MSTNLPALHEGVYTLLARWPVADPEAVAERVFRGAGPSPNATAVYRAALVACGTATPGMPEGSLGRAIAALPEELRAAVLLRDVIGLGGETTAAVLGVDSASARIHRGRMALMAALSEREG